VRPPLLIAVMGPTASGKTALAEALAERLDAQLFNADAVQVYKGLDIGTAKSKHKERYKLLDLKEPQEPFGVGEYVLFAQRELEALWQQRRHAIFVGGTGLYIRALFEEYAELDVQPAPGLREALEERLQTDGLQSLVDELKAKDPAAAAKVDLNNPVRVRRALERALSHDSPVRFKLPLFEKHKLALLVERPVLLQRIYQRTQEMVHNGWVDEVKSLRDRGVQFDAPAMRAHGYRALYRYVEGHLTLEQALEQVVTDTAKYAKRQMTWLRTEPNVKFIEAARSLDELLADTHRLLELPEDNPNGKGY
jgi:tRNA dimethylallyltransferase